MLKLKSLHLSNIGRFVEEQNVDFSVLGNLIQVDGENRNTGGSSGSGKSTLFNALDFLLGLNDLPTTVLQSRLTKEKINVKGIFDWDGKNVTIERGNKLHIEIDDMVTEGSSKLSEEKLDEILGMPREIFRKILHKRQKEGGFFLEFTPKKMYEFLTDALNLAAERKKLETVENKLKELETTKNTRQTQVLTLQSSLKATQESILALGLPPIKDIHQNVVLELKGKYDVATEQCKKIEQKHKIEIEELERSRPQVTVTSYDSSVRDTLGNRSKCIESIVNSLVLAERERQQKAKSAITERNAKKGTFSYQISAGETATKQAQLKAEEIKKIRAAMCPTCEQSWVHESAKMKEAEFLKEMHNLKSSIALGLTAKEQLTSLLKEIELLQEEAKPIIDPQIAVLNNEIYSINTLIVEEKGKSDRHMLLQNAVNNEVLQKFAAEQSNLRVRQSQETVQTRGQMDVDRMAFEAAANKLKSYNDNVLRYETAINNMNANQDQYVANLDSTANSLVLVEEEISKAEELKKAVKLFISCSFDDALESIGDAATKIIRCIPTMSNATIQFEGQKETQDGKVKEEVNAVISVDGEVGIPIKSLSGGERSSVDLAVDLAVINFIEEESAKGIDVFILDEPFTGLDTVSIEMALEVLKNSNTNKKLIVVDHNPEVKELVSNRLIVVRDGATSTITGQELNG